ncbi:hypothetical protein [Rheinheimera pleomorphica]|uniref:hypothetical protein n=1 Tax=Rheinheimera pleomorphica TaxID=2703963 RepID=UPI001420FDB1|nr:hypothetical protein [Rheinheimera pleomorphica]
MNTDELLNIITAPVAEGYFLEQWHRWFETYIQLHKDGQFTSLWPFTQEAVLNYCMTRSEKADQATIFNSRGGFNLLELNNSATAEEIALLEQHTGLELPRSA